MNTITTTALLAEVLPYASAGFGFLAASLWYWSTVTRVEDAGTGNWDNAPIVKFEKGRRIDVLGTAERQTVINRWAAAATVATSVCVIAALAI